MLEAQQDFRAADALGDEIGYAGLGGPPAIILGLLAGDQDEGQFLQATQFRGANPLDQLQAVQLGHVQIGNHRLDRVIENQRLPGSIAVGFLAHIVMSLEVLHQRRTHDARVVDDEDAYRLGHLSHSPASSTTTRPLA